MTATHERTIQVTFGDCDPAGIVYYPNIYRWIDGTFHDYLRRFGGHAALCRDLGTQGLGLFETSARFLRPILDGDALVIAMTIAEWRNRSLHLDYAGRVGDAQVFAGTEVRGMFMPAPGGMTAGPMAAVRQVFEG